MNGMSLQKLVELHGFNKQITNVDRTVLPFRIVGQTSLYYIVDYEGDERAEDIILKECDETNDYILA